MTNRAAKISLVGILLIIVAIAIDMQYKPFPGRPDPDVIYWEYADPRFPRHPKDKRIRHLPERLGWRMDPANSDR